MYARKRPPARGGRHASLLQPLTTTTAHRCADCDDDDDSGQRRRVMSAEEASTGAGDAGGKQERPSTVRDLDSSRAQRAAETADIDHSTTVAAADVSFHPRRYDAVTIAASADLMQISAAPPQDNTMMIVQQQRSRRQPWSVDHFSPHHDTPNLVSSFSFSSPLWRAHKHALIQP